MKTVDVEQATKAFNTAACRKVKGMNVNVLDMSGIVLARSPKDQRVGSVDRVRSLVGEITAASSSQSQNIVHVNPSVQSIESSTQQNSALVEQVAAAAKSLSGQTERLTALVHRFRVAPG